VGGGGGGGHVRRPLLSVYAWYASRFAKEIRPQTPFRRTDVRRRQTFSKVTTTDVGPFSHTTRTPARLNRAERSARARFRLRGFLNPPVKARTSLAGATIALLCY